MRATLKKHALVTMMSLGIVIAAATGCAPTTPPAGANGVVGQVLFEIPLASGLMVDTATYTLAGPNGFSRTGRIDVSQSQTLSTVIGGIPVGGGYTVAIEAMATDATTSCAGASMPFSVAARGTVAVTVHLSCHEAPRTGSVAVNGTVNVCPVVDSLSATPAELFVGGSVALASAAHDADGGSSPLSFAWTTTSGTLSDATAADPRFTCTAGGIAAVTLTVSDGDATPGCADTATIRITCSGHADPAATFATTTPIKHLIVIFNENVSFDHYFGTYPNAQNDAGEVPFFPAPGTPVSNSLVTPLDVSNAFTPLMGLDLLAHNPNFVDAANGADAANPFRLGAAQAVTQDQGHNYRPEQQASDDGAMDLFPEFTGTAGPPPGAPPAATTKGLVMAYFDGNTVSALWNYAQSFAMNDNSWTTTFGPSTPGAINLVSGQTNGIDQSNKPLTTFSTSHVTPDGNGGFTLIGDTDPLGDVCSTGADQNTFKGKNIGDLLNAAGITWGWFEGGFDLGVNNPNGTTGCARTTPQTVPDAPFNSKDYIPHHQPFQYYPSTANPTHARPSSVAAIGRSMQADGVTPDPANHQYDSHDFFDALAAGNLPAVSYVKAPAFQDGHAGYSNPIDEQTFIVQVVNAVQTSQEWGSTAIVIAYDDSDGWYDHQAPPIVNPSFGAADALNGDGICNRGAQQNGPAPATPLLGVDGNPALGRCGYGTRMPLLVISPHARRNFVDHTLTDQSSILRFVEDNWLGGQRIQPGGSFDTIAGTIENMFTF